MKKLLFIFTIFFIFGCTSTPKGDPSIYIEKTLREIRNKNIDFRDAYYKEKDNRGYEYFYFKVVSTVYLKNSPRSDSIIIYDNEGNEFYSRNLTQVYRLWQNNDFKPNQLYKIKYILKIRYDGYVDLFDLETIEGLLTYEELQGNARTERARIVEEKKLEIENAFQNALATRNPNTIMRFLHNNSLSSNNRNRGLTEIGRILTRDNNINVVDIPFERNPQAFDNTVIYHPGIYNGFNISQFIDRNTLLVWVGARSNNLLILLQNVPNMQSIIDAPSNQQGGTFFIWDVFMRYVGVTPLKMTDGSTRQVATFNVLYHFPLESRRQ